MGTAPPPISYATPAPPRRRRTHDVVYSTLLGVLVFMLSFSALTTWLVSRSPTFPPGAAWALHLVIATELLYAAFGAVILSLRITAPRRAKWPTVALNVCLLFLFPLGTVLAVYGLWKADRKPALPAAGSAWRGG